VRRRDLHYAPMDWGKALLRLAFPLLLAAAAACPAAGCAQALTAQPGQVLANEIAWGPAEALRQEEAFARSLAALAPQTPGEADVFVLAAGLWDDHVFLNEASKGAEALARRFGAQARTMTLANGPEASARGLPAATPRHLARALGEIGQRMDPVQDVLVLLITSHGAPRQGAVFHEEGRLQAVLSPEALAQSLREAGVRQRLVLVSACFSGAFIPPLSDPDSIVLSAAAADRPSFGCEPERDWTWFGDAFLNVALRGDAPLLKAFDTAKATIRGWEARQGQRPSNPSAHIGAALAARLPALERLQRPTN